MFLLHFLITVRGNKKEPKVNLNISMAIGWIIEIFWLVRAYICTFFTAIFLGRSGARAPYFLANFGISMPQKWPKKAPLTSKIKIIHRKPKKTKNPEKWRFKILKIHFIKKKFLRARTSKKIYFEISKAHIHENQCFSVNV